MRNLHLALLLSGLLAACSSSNPFDDTGSEDDAGNAPDTSANSVYATELNADLTMNSLEYRDNGTADTSDDTLLINNLPFDNADASGGGYTRAGALNNGFELYESPESSAASDRKYFAIFRRSDFSQVAAVATGDYLQYGFGGATAQRLGSGNVPAARPTAYTFTGDYASVIVPRTASGTNEIYYTTGTATLHADILDFDTNGAVEGVVGNRVLYDSDGSLLGNMNDYIALATADIDFTNAAILESAASTIEGTGTAASGNWQGIFAGPNGEEIAGIVVLEGASASLPGADGVRETGAFIVVNTE